MIDQPEREPKLVPADVKFPTAFNTFRKSFSWGGFVGIAVVFVAAILIIVTKYFDWIDENGVTSLTGFLFISLTLAILIFLTFLFYTKHVAQIFLDTNLKAIDLANESFEQVSDGLARVESHTSTLKTKLEHMDDMLDKLNSINPKSDKILLNRLVNELERKATLNHIVLISIKYEFDASKGGAGAGATSDAPFFSSILYNLYVRNDCSYHYYLAKSDNYMEDINLFGKRLLNDNLSLRQGFKSVEHLSYDQKLATLRSKLNFYPIPRESIILNMGLLTGVNGHENHAFVMPSIQLSDLFVRIDGEAKERFRSFVKHWSETVTPLENDTLFN